MKKIWLLAGIIVWGLGINSSLYGFEPQKKMLIQIDIKNHDQINEFINMRLTLTDARQTYVQAIVTEKELEMLKTKGYKVQILVADFVKEMRLLRGKEDFHDYNELTAQLQTIAAQYPNIVRLYDMGDSVESRNIWAIKITDNPDIEENEAEVCIMGAHHGNEFMSVEIPLNLVHYLVENYGVNPEVTYLVNNREIWIVPMVNPDGNMVGSRENANGIDLNRDYGYQWDGEGNSWFPFSQPETQAMRGLFMENPFTLSLSYHCSGDVVNYLWNYSPHPTPDESLIIELSQGYGSFNNYWVTNGYDWYQTRGDTNDFAYGCRGDIDWTIEVANYGISTVWNKHKDAILYIINEAGRQGIQGLVTDAQTGNPVSAIVDVIEVNCPIFTDTKIGDYHRLLAPGVYTVKFSANGYALKVIQGVEVISGTTTVFNVELNKDPNYHYAHNITSCRFYDPYFYPSNFNNNPTEAFYALEAPDGVFASLGKGGDIVLDMGIEIIDKTGSDFIVYEGNDGKVEGYSVYASNNYYGSWILVGNGMGTSVFDMANAGLSTARYIKIVDDNDGNASEKYPGFDVDAVSGTPIFAKPSILISTNQEVYSPNDSFTSTVHLLNPGQQTNVDLKLWIEIPGISSFSYLNLYNFSIAAGYDQMFPYLTYTFTQSDIEGTYKFGGRLSEVITGGIISDGSKYFKFIK
ncbi:MAG: carboxypeptidase N/E family protein [Nitrospirota bacterium]